MRGSKRCTSGNWQVSMSRGLGHIQRKTLSVLAEQPILRASEVAALVFKVSEGSPTTPAQYSSVRRALASLVRHHHILDLGGFYTGVRHSYCLREEAFWLLHSIYKKGGGARAFWPNWKAAIFYGIELRLRRRDSLEQLRRLKLHRWRHEGRNFRIARQVRRRQPPVDFIL